MTKNNFHPFIFYIIVSLMSLKSAKIKKNAAFLGEKIIQSSIHSNDGQC